MKMATTRSIYETKTNDMFLDLFMPSFRNDHADLLCIVQISTSTSHTSLFKNAQERKPKKVLKQCQQQRQDPSMKQRK
uniref:Putative ovule protein n=1 Tax=Solanum chacoense TaxID=4108 RepID=A0A0V0HEW7_SOLCH